MLAASKKCRSIRQKADCTGIHKNGQKGSTKSKSSFNKGMIYAFLTVANEIVALPHSENVNFGVSVGIINYINKKPTLH